MRDLLRKFAREQSGAVAVIFGLSVVPLLGVAGAALDYNRVSNARVAAVSAADAAALEAVKGRAPFAQRREAAMRVFEANMAAQNVPLTFTVNITQVMETVPGSREPVETAVRVSVSGQVPTKLISVVGIQNLPLTVDAEAQSASRDRIDVAFVLDTTDSMEGDRILALKNAANLLLDDFQANAANSDQIRVAVVPFAQYVNVGMGYRNAPWMDVPADYQTPITNWCRTETPVVNWINCRRVNVPAQPAVPPSTCMRDGRPRQCGGSPAQPAYSYDACDPVYGPPQNVCSPVGGDWVRWNGCVGSRNSPLDTFDGSWTNRAPGIMGVTCGSPLLPWTNNISSARSMINGLTTAGETYLPSGLFWGWVMLSTQEPFASRAATPGSSVRRFMILVTDGQNTISPTYPAHNGTDGAQANAITRQICQNMSTDTDTRVRLYAVSFEVNDPSVHQMLRDCARLNGGEFIDAQNPTQLVEAFRNIGRQIWTTRLSR